MKFWPITVTTVSGRLISSLKNKFQDLCQLVLTNGPRNFSFRIRLELTKKFETRESKNIRKRRYSINFTNKITFIHKKGEKMLFLLLFLQTNGMINSSFEVTLQFFQKVKDFHPSVLNERHKKKTLHTLTSDSLQNNFTKLGNLKS